MGRFVAGLGLNSITDYRTNCVANDHMSRQLNAQGGQEYRHKLVNNAEKIAARRERINRENHKRSCAACPLCRKEKDEGVLQKIYNFLFG